MSQELASDLAYRLLAVISSPSNKGIVEAVRRIQIQAPSLDVSLTRDEDDPRIVYLCFGPHRIRIEEPDEVPNNFGTTDSNGQFHPSGGRPTRIDDRPVRDPGDYAALESHLLQSLGHEPPTDAEKDRPKDNPQSPEALLLSAWKAFSEPLRKARKRPTFMNFLKTINSWDPQAGQFVRDKLEEGKKAGETEYAVIKRLIDTAQRHPR